MITRMLKLKVVNSGGKAMMMKDLILRYRKMMDHQQCRLEAPSPATTIKHGDVPMIALPALISRVVQCQDSSTRELLKQNVQTAGPRRNTPDQSVIILIHLS